MSYGRSLLTTVNIWKPFLFFDILGEADVNCRLAAIVVTASFSTSSSSRCVTGSEQLLSCLGKRRVKLSDNYWAETLSSKSISGFFWQVLHKPDIFFSFFFPQHWLSHGTQLLQREWDIVNCPESFIPAFALRTNWQATISLCAEQMPRLVTNGTNRTGFQTHHLRLSASEKWDMHAGIWQSSTDEFG